MTEQKKKQLDDTDLEWYGLTEEDIEKMKEEGDFIDGDIMLLEAQLRVLLEKHWFSVKIYQDRS